MFLQAGFPLFKEPGKIQETDFTPNRKLRIKMVFIMP